MPCRRGDSARRSLGGKHDRTEIVGRGRLLARGRRRRASANHKQPAAGAARQARARRRGARRCPATGTRNLRPVDQDVTPTGWARVSFVRDAPDGRRFANDSRGFLYIIDDGRTSLYHDFGALFPHAWYNRIESGFIGFDFHPEFARNGLWYSVHLERAEGNPARPDFIPPGYDSDDVTFHNVITEWRANDPRASTFTGTRRELLRVAHVVQFSSHPMGARRVQPHGAPGLAGLRVALYERQRPRVQQRRRPEREQSDGDAAFGLRDHGDLAHRPAQPARDERREGARRLHDSGRQQVSSRRRSENARRDLRVRLPQRASAGVGSHATVRCSWATSA